MFAASSLGVVIAMILAAALYAILTFGFRLDPAPDYSLMSKVQGAEGEAEMVPDTLAR